jgi:cytochrome c oxidase assembly factor CtaG
MQARGADRVRTVAAVATLIGGTCIAAFWAMYFTSSAALGHGDPAVHAFEEAFLVADGVFAAVLVTAGVALLRRRPSGTFLLVAAAAMSLYLALLDLTFYTRQGLYAPLSASALTELAVNALCLGGGVLGLRCGWLLWARRSV